ncbi:MAG: hypothetical protein JJ863_09435 [Deltaproteobacteria bacterium]|nr:hypothetical protein [Deltaproteobacteria bacterium]
MGSSNPLPAQVVLVIAAALTLASLVSGCRIYDEALVVDGDAMVDTDGGTPAQDCEPAGPPSRPDVSDDGTGDETERFYVIRDLTLRQTENELWQRTGYDIDGICTYSPTLTSECSNRTSSEDGERGIDNVFGARLFPLFELTIANYQDSMQAMHEQGRNALALSIRGWNGEPDDSSVFVAAYTTVSATSEGAASDEPPTDPMFDATSRLSLGGSPAPEPTWDGRDWVWLREDSFVGVDAARPVISDDEAYVRDGRLVFSLPDRAEFMLFGVDVREGREGELLTSRVRLTDGVLTVALDTEGDALSAGVIAGRWPLDDILVTTREIGICETDPLADLLQTQLLGMSDLRDEPPTPGEPLRACNALSLGASFRASPVRFAGTAPGPQPIDVCDARAGGD